MMKAIVCTQYGPPEKLQFKDVVRPEPKDGEVLVKIKDTGLNAADWHLMRGDPFLVRFSYGLSRPKHAILGADVAGVIEAVGKGVTRFQPGDAVIGELASVGFGGLAEYVCAPETVWTLKPANLSFEEAAAVPMAAVTALQGLRDVGQIQPAHKVLIHGASGGVGTFAVQIAKSFGAEVTAVCSTSKMAQAKALGADHVIDYTREDFSRNGQQYDLIFAANGNRSLADYERALAPTGIYVMAGGASSQMFQAIALGRFKSKAGGKHFLFLSASANHEYLVFVTGLIEAGKIKPVIDRCYPLSQTPEAMRYLEAGHAGGKIVVCVDQHN